MYRIVTSNGDVLASDLNIASTCSKLAEYLDGHVRSGVHKEIAYTVEWVKKIIPGEKVLSVGQAILLADYVVYKGKDRLPTIDDYIASEGGIKKLTYAYSVTTEEVEEVRQFIINHV